MFFSTGMTKDMAQAVIVNKFTIGHQYKNLLAT
jgi:hypothetical protein